MNKLFFSAIIITFFTSSSLNALKYAGILPYEKHHGKIYFLLGREAHGRHSGTWADFGGKEDLKKDRGEVKNIAIREFTEETHGNFGKRFKSTISDPYEADKKYLEGRMSQPIVNPGPKKYYSLFLAEVDYIEPNIFSRGPVRDYEKNQFAWVNAEEFINAMAQQTDNHNAYYKDKKIRPPFAQYFMNPKTRKEIESILGISKPISESEEEGWVPAGGYYAEPWEEEGTEEESEWIESYEKAPTYYPPQPIAQPYYPSQPTYQPTYPSSTPSSYQTPGYQAQAYPEAYQHTEKGVESCWVPDRSSITKELERNLRKLQQKLQLLKIALPKKRR